MKKNDNEKQKQITFKLAPKQQEALTYLRDDITTEILLSGGSGTAKTWAALYHMLMMSLQYAGFRTILIRQKINLAKTTTILSLKELMKHMGMGEEMLSYDVTTNSYTFPNGSMIMLVSGELTPEDKMNNLSRAGGVEGSLLIIEEANSVDFKIFDIFKTRLRFRPNSLKDKPFTFKTICLTNPDTNSWLYNYFWLKKVKNTMSSYMAVVHSVLSDNPFADPEYVLEMSRKTGITYRRLFLGEWVNEDEEALLPESKMVDLFDYTINTDNYVATHISADFGAGIGKDYTVIFVWSNKTIIDASFFNDKDTVYATKKIIELATKYDVARTSIYADGDGIGTGITDTLKCVKIKNNGTPINREHYQNLKTQLYYKLSEHIDEVRINAAKFDEDTIVRIKQELTSFSRIQKNDNKLKITEKDEVKKMLGRSPDFSDSIAYGMYPLVNSRKKGIYYIY